MTRPLFEPSTPRGVVTNAWGVSQLQRRPVVLSAAALDTFPLVIPKVCWWEGSRIEPLTGPVPALPPTDTTDTRDGDWTYIPLVRDVNNPYAGGYRDPYFCFDEDIDGNGFVRSVNIVVPGVYLLSYKVYWGDTDPNRVTSFGYWITDHVNLIRVWGNNGTVGADADDAEATNAEVLVSLTDDGTLASLNRATGQELVLIQLADAANEQHEPNSYTPPGGVCIAYRHDDAASIDNIVQASLRLVRIGDAGNFASGDLDTEGQIPYGIHIDAVAARRLVTLDVDGDSVSLLLDFGTGIDGSIRLNDGTSTCAGADNFWDDFAAGTAGPGSTDIFSDDFEGATIVPPWTSKVEIDDTITLDTGTLKMSSGFLDCGAGHVEKTGLTLPDTFSVQVLVKRTSDGAPSFSVEVGTYGIVVGVDDINAHQWVIQGSLDMAGVSATVGSIPVDTWQTISVTVAPA